MASLVESGAYVAINKYDTTTNGFYAIQFVSESYTLTNILRDVLDTSYYDNIRTWMKYCACYNYDSMFQWLLFPITIRVFFHGAKILCLDN